MATKTMVPVKERMETLKRWDPFALMESLQEEMTQRWGETWPWWPTRALRRASLDTTWMPRMDIFEKNGNLVVKAELPGVKKEDVEVTLEGGDLIVKGERKTETEVKEEDYYRSERTFGSFYRAMPLPFEVKPEQIKAEYKDGVLEILIPKPTETKQTPQPIKVS